MESSRVFPHRYHHGLTWFPLTNRSSLMVFWLNPAKNIDSSKLMEIVSKLLSLCWWSILVIYARYIDGLWLALTTVNSHGYLAWEFPPRNISLTLCINITYDQWNKQLVHLPFPCLILHNSQFYSQHVIDTFAPCFFLRRGRIRASFLGTRSHLRDQSIKVTMSYHTFVPLHLSSPSWLWWHTIMLSSSG